MTPSAESRGRILVVDDAVINRRLLERAIHDHGFQPVLAENGEQALEILRATEAPQIDVVLLDIIMPVLDGYETLSAIKADPALHHLPVIMITAIDEIESAVRCIELGAMDYLPKPFNASLLYARLGASLAEKRLRDLEREYLEQVSRVTDAAASVESGSFEISGCDSVALRGDALGSLARMFQRMVREVRAREERLQKQVRELQIEIDEARQASKVAEITETEYFRKLRGQAAELRRLMD